MTAHMEVRLTDSVRLVAREWVMERAEISSKLNEFKRCRQLVLPIDMTGDLKGSTSCALLIW